MNTVSINILTFLEYCTKFFYLQFTVKKKHLSNLLTFNIYFRFVTEVECEVSSQVEYSLQAIWGVSIRELHLALWKPWNALRDASLNGTLLQGHAQYLTPPQTYEFHNLILIHPHLFLIPLL